MGETTAIEWTNVPGYIGATWNPWQGCTKVSPGCKFCYMYREKQHYGQDPAVVVRSRPPTFNLPLRTKEPHAFFANSWSDFLHEAADAWRPEAWEIIRQTPQHLYLIPTKRPENLVTRLPEGWFPRNIWWGVSIESQEYLNRWDILDSALHYYVPPVMFISAEPLLGTLDLSPILEEVDAGDEDRPWQTRAPDWIIGGGESGTDARPCHPDWARSLRDQCTKTETPFFWKQWGEWYPATGVFESDAFAIHEKPVYKWNDHLISLKLGKKTAGCILDGQEWKQFPEALKGAKA